MKRRRSLLCAASAALALAAALLSPLSARAAEAKGEVVELPCESVYSIARGKVLANSQDSDSGAEVWDVLDTSGDVVLHTWKGDADKGPGEYDSSPYANSSDALWFGRWENALILNSVGSKRSFYSYSGEKLIDKDYKYDSSSYPKIAVSSDDRFVACVVGDGTVDVVSMDSVEIIRSIPCDEDQGVALFCTENGREDVLMVVEGFGSDGVFRYYLVGQDGVSELGSCPRNRIRYDSASQTLTLYSLNDNVEIQGVAAYRSSESVEDAWACYTDLQGKKRACDFKGNDLSVLLDYGDSIVLRASDTSYLVRRSDSSGATLRLVDVKTGLVVDLPVSGGAYRIAGPYFVVKDGYRTFVFDAEGNKVLDRKGLCTFGSLKAGGRTFYYEKEREKRTSSSSPLGSLDIYDADFKSVKTIKGESLSLKRWPEGSDDSDLVLVEATGTAEESYTTKFFITNTDFEEVKIGDYTVSPNDVASVSNFDWSSGAWGSSATCADKKAYWCKDAAGKYGAVDLGGNVVVPFEYDDYRDTNTSGAYVCVKRDGKWYVYDAGDAGDLAWPWIEKGMFTVDEGGAVYTGREVSGRVSSKGLREGKDYSVEYSDNVEPGEAKIRVKGLGSYRGTLAYGFSIAKAEPEYEAPSGLAAEEGQTLADVALPEGWSWQDSAQSVGTAGEHTFKADYAPGDSAHYETVRGVELTVKVSAKKTDPEPSAGKVTLTRLYNRRSGEHLYTYDANEIKVLTSGKNSDWKREGTAWESPKASKTPVYRLYNRRSGNHLFTADENEKDVLSRGDWNWEGIAWYSDDNKGVPVYRLYTPDLRVGDHHFTTDKNEYDKLPSLGNWRQENVAWYALAG